MQVTSGAVGTFRFENACVPEQLLKLYPTAIAVRTSSEDTVKLIGVPCAVLPLHWPPLNDEADGDVGPSPHPEARSAAKVPTHHTAFVRVHIATPLGQLLFPRVSCLRVSMIELTSERAT
jgi:hypothetical protein